MQLGGFYYDDAGTGVADKTVNVYARNTVTPVIGTDTTDSTGYWQVTGLAEGRYDFEIVDGSIKRRGKYDDEVQFESLDIATLYLRNPADTFTYAITPAAITANRVLNLPLITATDTLAVLGLAQTFTVAKTFNDQMLLVRNPADTFSYTIVAGAITAARSLTLPVITGTDTVDVLGLAQTFSAVKTFSAIPVMSGGAVGFPATQAASATANDLDDYEEGTWTPGISFGGAAVGVAYDNQFGYYTKIGNMVHAVGLVALTSNGTSVGAALVTGLPFTVANVSGYAVPVALSLSAVTYANMAIADAPANTTTIALREITEAGTQTNLADTDVPDTASIRVSLSYRV